MNQNILKIIRDSKFSFSQLSCCYPELCALKNIPQNPEYHKEGDVYHHTELVCEKLLALFEWKELTQEEQELLFLAAAFHDIGKIYCTKQENGIWISPKHTIVGERVFRQMAYKKAEQYSFTFHQRETIAKLIRYHGLPIWFWTKDRTEFDLLKAAESIPLRLLYLLSKADVTGRITKDPAPFVEQVELFADYAQELGVWKKSFAFANPYTKYQYFHREKLWHKAELCDDTKFDVLLMCGLPLSGKDSWIAQHGAGLPVVSLDEIREQLRLPPTKNSGKVAQIATEQARIFLRKKNHLSGMQQISSKKPDSGWSISLLAMVLACAFYIWKCPIKS